MKKKILAFCSALVLLITSFPLSPLSVTAQETESITEEETTAPTVSV